MYPRNAASPERLAVGAVVLISDGTVQTSGVSIAVVPQGGASGAGGGTTAYDNGIVLYTPTQAETNYASFIVTAYKASCIPVSITVVTSKSDTTGYAGLDWGQMLNKTTTNALTGTTIASTQKVDVETIKTNPVVNAGTVTFPTTATLASTTNITAGTVTTATNVTTVNGLAAGVITAASIAADAITDAKVASDVTIASVTGAVGSVTGAVGSVTGAVGSVTGNVGGNVTGSVGSVVGAVGSVTGLTASDVAAIKAKTDNLPAAPASTTNITAATGISLATGGIATGDIDATALNEIADAILDRVLSAGADSGADTTAARTVRQALRALRNRVAIAAGTMTVYKENDTTASWTAAMTRTAGDPISESNPT